MGITTIAIGVGMFLIALLGVLIAFYIGLSGPVKEVLDGSKQKYQYFSERSNRTGRRKRKQSADPDEPVD